MKKNKVSTSLILSNIIVGFLWLLFCMTMNRPFIIPWIGFAGWTSFYMANKNINQSLVSNIAGFLIGSTIVYLSKFSSNIFYNSFITGILTGLIIYLMNFRLTKNSAITFIGGFSAFAINGDLIALLISFILGNLLGLLTEAINYYLQKIFENFKLQKQKGAHNAKEKNR